ncbi:hypothetical protein O205_00760 [Bacillus amyloliquefaciens EGD-AQ14]|nr:hypothetical protein O205_00760 [Bacillus amyloliquefaciens EGD-AQ14]
MDLEEEHKKRGDRPLLINEIGHSYFVGLGELNAL